VTTGNAAATADINSGGGSTSGNAILSLFGAAEGEADVSLGGGDGANANVDLGGGGAGLPGGTTPGGDGTLPPDNEVADAIGSLSAEQIQQLRLNCEQVVTSPARFSAAQLQVCRIVETL